MGRRAREVTVTGEGKIILKRLRIVVAKRIPSIMIRRRWSELRCDVNKLTIFIPPRSTESRRGLVSAAGAL
jgi:hypothetical protein